MPKCKCVECDNTGCVGLEKPTDTGLTKYVHAVMQAARAMWGMRTSAECACDSNGRLGLQQTALRGR